MCAQSLEFELWRLWGLGVPGVVIVRVLDMAELVTVYNYKQGRPTGPEI